MVEEWFLLRRARNEQAHISIIYIVVYTWIQMSNCIINRANTRACFVAYSRARALYLVRLRCTWRCWCLKIRQEIICRRTHSHTPTLAHSLTCVAWRAKWKTWERSTQKLIYYVDAVNWCGREHSSCLLASVSFVCHLIMHAAPPLPLHTPHNTAQCMCNLLKDI